MKRLVISIDFDGCITSMPVYPQLGKLREEAKVYIQKLYEQGHCIIINTNREEGQESKVRSFLDHHNIPYHYFNENDHLRIRQFGMDTRKIGADIYIDDKQVGGMPHWDEIYKFVQFEAKPKIICIVGESGCGKTMISEYLKKEFGIPMIESYTTRPKRTPDEVGHTFITDDEFNMLKESDMIAFTQFGDYRYCCLKKDVSDLCTYVIDEDGLEYLKDNFSDEYSILSVRKHRRINDRIKQVGLDRVNRDKGRFKMMRDEFDFNIESYPDVNLVFDEVRYMLDCILVYKRDDWGNSIY